MKIFIAQLNPTVGDIDGNLTRLEEEYSKAAGQGCDIAVFPELYLTGYPPKDILERPWFIKKVVSALKRCSELSKKNSSCALVVGAPVSSGDAPGTGLYNSALMYSSGSLLHAQAKSLLPTYDVFDEVRHFDTAREVKVVEYNGKKLGLTVCEDAWHGHDIGSGVKRYANDPVAELAGQGAELLINISASPFTLDKDRQRVKYISEHSKKHGIPFIYVNQVGGNDELVFDGHSFVVAADGRLLMEASAFQEDTPIIDLSADLKPYEYKAPDRMQSLHDALVLGTRDYLAKCGFKKAVIGLSGGIDSALVCYIASQALGPKQVLGVSMPSQYSSDGSRDDARKLAENLGVEYRTLAINDIYQSYADGLTDSFAGKEPDVTEENIQARIRGNILMAFSNKYGCLTLTTGNKSELAVGYCTLYGDMSGGLAVISDVPKTMVYELCRYINRDGEIIPEATLTKPPSAELRPDQKDQDSLPPYDVLDAILAAYIEEHKSAAELIEGSEFDAETVKWVVRTVDRNEYKRKQAAPGLKVTSKAFGIGRRMPVAARFNY